MKKQFYSYVKTKLKLSTAIHLLYDNDEDKKLTSDFEIGSLFNRSLQQEFKKDYNHQNFKLAQKK